MDEPVSYVFPWDEAKHRLFGWKLLISWLAFGCIVNFLQLVLHGSIRQLRKQPICRVIIWLSSIDFAFDFLCLLQCSLNLHFKEFFGEQALCTAQAFWAEFLMAMSGFSIGCTMFASYLAIVHNHALTRWEVDKLHIGAGIYCLILAILCTISPGEGTLNSSGLFCYTAAQFVLEGALFHIGYIFPLIGTLIFFWARMYQRVKEMTKFLVKRKINVEARKGQVQMAKRMAWYIYILLLCFAPYELAVWYSWITRKHAPYQMWITFGMFGHVLTVASPILYYVLNQSARQIVWKHLVSFWCPSKRKEMEGSLQSRSEHSRSGTLERSIRRRDKRLVDAAQIEELRVAMSNIAILNQILATADAQWCSEGVLFWIDVQVWRTKCIKLADTPTSKKRQRGPSASGLAITDPARERGLSSSASSSSASDIPQSPTTSGTTLTGSPTVPVTKNVPSTPEALSVVSSMSSVLSSTNSNNNSNNTNESKVNIKERESLLSNEEDKGGIEGLRDFAKQIYLTYFIRGGELSAPLELNLKDELHSRIVKELKIDAHGECKIEFTPETVYIFDDAEEECLRLLYDNVYRPFASKINMTDVKENQARLKNLGSGDLLPFEADDLNGDESRSKSTSDFQTSGIIAPKGAGGVFAKRLPGKASHTPQSLQTPISGSPGMGPALTHHDREESISRSLTLDTSISGLHRSGSGRDVRLPEIEVVHVGIDLTGLKIISQERESISHHLVPSTSSQPTVPSSPPSRRGSQPELRLEIIDRSQTSTPSLSSLGEAGGLPPITEAESPRT